MICQCFTNTNTINTIFVSKTASILEDVPIIFLELYMFLMCQVQSFAARRCWLMICLSLSNTYAINMIHISKIASKSDEYCSSYIYFPLFHHEKWRPHWIFEIFQFFFLPMSLLSFIGSIYRKLHQNGTSSSRVIEEQPDTQTHRHTLPFY